jgi:hypothetical protein
MPEKRTLLTTIRELPLLGRWHEATGAVRDITRAMVSAYESQ